VTTTTPRRAIDPATPKRIAPDGATAARPQASQHAHTVERPPGGAHDTRRAIDLAVTISVPPAGYHHAGRRSPIDAQRTAASGIPLSRPAVEAPSPRTRAPGGVQLAGRHSTGDAQEPRAASAMPAGYHEGPVAHGVRVAGSCSRPAKISASPMAVPRGGSDLTGGHAGVDTQRTHAAGAFSRPAIGVTPPRATARGGHLLAGRRTTADFRCASAASVLPADRRTRSDALSMTAVGFYSRPADVLPAPVEQAPGGPHHAGRRLPADVQVLSAAGIYSRLSNLVAVSEAHPADGALHADRRAQHGTLMGFAASVQPADRHSGRVTQETLAAGSMTQTPVAGELSTPILPAPWGSGS